MKTIKTSLKGKQLLNNSLLNKDTAFTKKERAAFALDGLLPTREETITEQSKRHYAQYQELTSDMQKIIYLNQLCNRNETLFYKLVSEHLIEMLPIIYTPVVGDLVQQFSKQFRTQRGLYLTYNDRDNIANILDNRVNKEIERSRNCQE